MSDTILNETVINKKTTSNKGTYEFFDFEPAHADMAVEVLRGLRSEPKYIEPKYFYDAVGSELFEQITRLDEYYLTRTEMSLFDAHLKQIAELVGPSVCLVEYGSGNSLKIRKLLEAILPSAYVPVDISSEHLQDNARALHRDFSHLDVYPICADFSAPVELPEAVSGHNKVAFFPGSSIGNFSPRDAQTFLRNVQTTVGSDGLLLIGIDRKKDVDVLEAAYDDAAGVTATFNLNSLVHLNDRLGADFDIQAFDHVSRYNAQLGCIQMFLRTQTAQSVSVAGQKIEFAAGEELHTENSYKYHPEEFEALAVEAGFGLVQHFSDGQDRFSLFLLRAA